MNTNFKSNFRPTNYIWAQQNKTHIAFVVRTGPKFKIEIYTQGGTLFWSSINIESLSIAMKTALSFLE